MAWVSPLATMAISFANDIPTQQYRAIEIMPILLFMEKFSAGFMVCGILQ
jgi:hypothetical protein